MSSEEQQQDGITDEQEIEPRGVTTAEPLCSDDEEELLDSIPTIQLRSSTETDDLINGDDYGPRSSDVEDGEILLVEGSDRVNLSSPDDLTRDNSSFTQEPNSQSAPPESEATLMPSSSSQIGNTDIGGNKRQRQRLVSEDGIVAEFDMQDGTIQRHDDPQDRTLYSQNSTDVVAKAVEVCNSIRSVNDLELGDEEPLSYYSGGRLSFANLRALGRGASSGSGSGRNIRSSNHGAGGAGAGGAGVLRSAAGMYARAELISVTVIKNSTEESIGISLLADDTVVYAVSHEEGSLLKDCPIQPGDKLLSINNKRTERMDSAETARMLREVTGFITIVVHNEAGDPTLVETMITKANKNQRSGMGLKSTGERDLRVSSINENGLFAHSLLNVGDRILAINNVDCTEMDARVACDIIRNAPSKVTVVARVRHTHGLVVAEVSNQGLDATENFLASVPEATTARVPGEIHAVDDTCSMNLSQRQRMLLKAFIGALLVAMTVVVLVR